MGEPVNKKEWHDGNVAVDDCASEDSAIAHHAREQKKASVWLLLSLVVLLASIVGHVCDIHKNGGWFSSAIPMEMLSLAVLVASAVSLRKSTTLKRQMHEIKTSRISLELLKSNVKKLSDALAKLSQTSSRVHPEEGCQEMIEFLRVVKYYKSDSATGPVEEYTTRH